MLFDDRFCASIPEEVATMGADAKAWEEDKTCDLYHMPKSGKDYIFGSVTFVNYLIRNIFVKPAAFDCSRRKDEGRGRVSPHA